jgi:hypothetical protein
VDSYFFTAMSLMLGHHPRDLLDSVCMTRSSYRDHNATR